MFTAAEEIGYASRPILLFYGLSQAGRAIAAASAKADNNNFKLTGHGITTPNLDQRPALHELIVIDHGAGSFTQLAPLLQSGSLPRGEPLGQIWAVIPDLLGQPLASTTGYLPPLRFEAAMVLEAGTQQQVIHGSVHGLPARLSVAADPKQAVVEFLSSYPSLTGSGESHLADGIMLNDRHTGTGWVMRAWPSPPNPADPAEYTALVENFEDRCTLPYRGDDDRWVFPALGGDTTALHPLLVWWAPPVRTLHACSL